MSQTYKQNLWTQWMPLSHLGVGLVLSTIFINLLSAAFPLAILQIYDRVVPNEAIETLVYLFIGVLIILFVELGLKIARQVISLWADARLEYMLGCYSFHQLLQADLLEYEKQSTGKRLDQLNSVKVIKDHYGGSTLISFIELPFTFVFMGIIAYIGGILVIVPIIMMLITAMITYHTDKKADQVTREKMVIADRRNNFLVELFTNMHTIKSYAMEALMLRRYERLQESIVKNEYQQHDNQSTSVHISQTLAQLNVVAVVVFGAFLIVQGSLTVGALAACTLLAGKVIQPVMRIFTLWSKFSVVRIAKEQLSHVIKIPGVYTSGVVHASLIGDIEINNINFSYGNNQDNLFENLSVHINPGECVVIDGSEISGRSTLLALMAGMYEPQQGSIYIDSKPISYYNNQQYRESIAYITQDEALFEGTILDNLTMFQRGDYIDRAYAIADALGLDRIIREMPDGYDTKISYNNVDVLSRGVTQKIAIARAFSNDPKIVFFDEANSAMDLIGDRFLTQFITEIKGSATIVLVTHCPYLQKLADRKYFIENKKLREGSH